VKKCKKCGAVKPTLEFTRDVKKPDGLNSRCRECTRKASALTAAKNPDAAKKRSQKWYLENKEKSRAKTEKWQKENREKSAEYCAKWRKENKDFANFLSREWYAKNREKALAKDREAREKNLKAFLERERASYAKNREKRLERHKKWAENNPDKIRFYASSRRSALQKRTPPWLTDLHFEQMQDFFTQSVCLEKETGVKHHVDHIIPLRGKIVSGLNVPWNLQILTAVENLRKNNIYEA